jgi:Tol biopolymer transport system component
VVTRRPSGKGSTINRIFAFAVLLAVLIVVVGCAAVPTPSRVAVSGDSRAAASGAPTFPLATIGSASQPLPATAILGSPRVPPGRLVFGTWDPSLEDFVVYSSSVDGSDLRMLVPGPHEIPRWSPDGTEVAVTSIGMGGKQGYPSANVFTTVLSADGTINRHLAVADSALILGCSAWSPDGTQLACEGWDETAPGREGLYLVDAGDGRRLQRVTTSTGGLHDIPGSFSPDGKQIVYVHVTHDVEEFGELWIVDADGRNRKRVGDENVGFNSAYSPDGQSILAEVGGQFVVYDVTDSSTAPRRIDVPGLTEFGGRWSPDGRSLVFSGVAGRGRNSDLYTMNVDGTDLRRVTSTAEKDEFADWAVPPD